MSARGGTADQVETGESSRSYGVRADEGLVVEGGEITAEGSYGLDYSHGIYADKKIWVKGGTVIARGGIGGNKSYGIYLSGKSYGLFFRCGRVIAQVLPREEGAEGFALDESPDLSDCESFFWRAAGSPAPKSSAMPFADVTEDAYYYDAVLWAAENGITAGTSDTAFSPDAFCTRAQAVTFLWRAADSPAPKSGTMPFSDVAEDSYYHDAVLWATENGITTGTSATAFSPSDNCTRAQDITFLYRSAE